MNADFLTRMIWKLVKPIMEKRTVEKVRIHIQFIFFKPTKFFFFFAYLLLRFTKINNSYQITLIGTDQKEIYNELSKEIPYEFIPTIYGGPFNCTEGLNYDNPHNE